MKFVFLFFSIFQRIKINLNSASEIYNLFPKLSYCVIFPEPPTHRLGNGLFAANLKWYELWRMQLPRVPSTEDGTWLCRLQDGPISDCGDRCQLSKDLPSLTCDLGCDLEFGFGSDFLVYLFVQPCKCIYVFMYHFSQLCLQYTQVLVNRI